MTDEELARMLQDEENRAAALIISPQRSTAVSVPPRWGFSIFGRKREDSVSQSPDQELTFAQCQTKEEKMSWLRSERGRKILAARPRLNELYQSGKLVHMIDSPHWSDKLNVFLDDSLGLHRGHGGIVGGHSFHSIQQPSIAHSPRTLPRPLPTFPTEAKYSMLIDGYAILPSIISRTLTYAAVKFINNKIGKQRDDTWAQQPGNLTSSFSTEADLLNLYYGTPLHGLVHVLLHGDTDIHSSSGTCPRACQIALRFPEMGNPPSDGLLGGHQWHIDGLDKGQHSAFTLLVGVALSDQSEPFNGNLCCFPGSHYQVSSALKGYVESNLYHVHCEAASEGVMSVSNDKLDDVDDNDYNATRAAWLSPGGGWRRPDLDEPLQVLVKTGDVILVHHKVAHRGGPNFGCDIRRMVYFRVQHRDHAQLAETALSDIWLEFAGMSDVLS